MAAASQSKLRVENEALRADIQELRLRLDESEQALEAIRTGKVESLVLEGPDGPRIFSLEGATQSYRVLVEAMNEGAVTLSEDGTVLYCNARFAAMLGKPLQTVMGGSLREHIPKHSRAAIDELLERARESAVREEMTLRTSDGHEIPAYLSVSSIADDGRRVLCLVATDLREQKRTEAIAAAEEAARESEERLRQTLRYAAAGTWEWGIATGALAWSPEIYDLYGVDPFEKPATYADWERLLHPDDLAATRAAAMECIEGRTPEFRAEFRVRNPRRGDRWLLGVGKVERAADGTAIRLLGLDIDITERKRAEEALRASEVRLRLALQAGGGGTWDFELENQHAWWSPETYEMFGVPAGTGMQLDNSLPLIHEEDRQRVVQVLEQSIERREDYRCEFRIRHPRRGERWIASQARLVCDESGKPLRMHGINFDITERKRAEEALHEADRRKDEFLGMLSHELRNPLAPIRNSTYILRHADPGSDQARRAQNVIERQTQHLTRLVDDLLDVTRIARGKIDLRRERVDLREVVRRTAEDLRSVIESRDLTFRVDVPDAIVWADVDQTRVGQAIGNLLHNAAKFTRRGSVTLSLESDGMNSQIHVHDTGAGIDPALLQGVFDAFVQGERTLARTEGGLGLGLALVKGIVELHGGKATASSNGVGHGAEFTLSLPVAAPTPEKDRPVGHASHHPSGRRVLVVDDNVDAAESLAETLKIAGHEVEVAFDGPTALDKVRLNPPDVVLCDIGLPGMSGYDVARRLRASGVNGVQLIAVSGYAQPEDIKTAVEAGFDGHVAKPCDPEEIERLLT